MKEKLLNCMISFLMLAILISGCEKNEDDYKINEDDFAESETLVDFDGNVYPTVKIEDQVWMTEPLKVKSFRNGELIQTTDVKRPNISSENNPCYYWEYKEAFAIYECTYYTWYAISDKQEILQR